MKKYETTLRSLFDTFYNNVYFRWRISTEKKAAKDIVGEEYEKMRSNWYISKGYTVGDNKNVFGSGVNTDLVIMKDGVIKICEEDKGSYVDGTFLKRALVDAATIFNTCLEKNLEPPYFILSCSTKMKNYNKIFDSVIVLFDEKIRNMLKEKFIYMPLCDHGRVSRDKYFKTENNIFRLSSEQLEIQENVINKIMK
jgi:hypothetical protein